MLARGATKEGVALDEGGGDKGGSSLFKEVSTLKMKLMASTKRRTQAETSEKVLLKALRNADGDCDRLAANAIDLLDALHVKNKKEAAMFAYLKKGYPLAASAMEVHFGGGKKKKGAEKAEVPSIEIVGPKGRTAEGIRRASVSADDVLHVSRSRCQEIVGKLAAHEEAFQKAFKASRLVGTDAVDKKAFRNLLKAMGDPFFDGLSEQEADGLFDFMDDDQGGTLEQKELNVHIRRAKNKATPGARRRSSKASVELASSLGSTGSSTAPKERRESKSPARKGSAGGRRTKA